MSESGREATHVCTPHCDDERGHYPAPAGRESSRSKTRWEGIVEVCKTCDRKAVWPFCEHKTDDGSWYRLVRVREVGR